MGGAEVFPYESLDSSSFVGGVDVDAEGTTRPDMMAICTGEAGTRG